MNKDLDKKFDKALRMMFDGLVLSKINKKNDWDEFNRNANTIRSFIATHFGNL